MAHTAASMRDNSNAVGHDRGFTLVELLVVMAIVGVLAAIAMPIYANAQKSAREEAAKQDVRAIQAAVERLLTVQMPPPTAPPVEIIGSNGTYEIASTPVTTGVLSTGNAVGANSSYEHGGVYCVSVTNSDGETFRVTDAQPLTQGTC